MTKYIPLYQWPHGYSTYNLRGVFYFAPKIQGDIHGKARRRYVAPFTAKGGSIEDAEKKARKMWLEGGYK